MGSPILHCPGARSTAIANWLALHPTSVEQMPEAPWEKGAVVPFPHGKSTGLPAGLHMSVPAILEATTAPTPAPPLPPSFTRSLAPGMQFCALGTGPGPSPVVRPYHQQLRYLTAPLQQQQ